MSFETQFLQVSSSVFFACLSRKTLDRFFILLHYCFYDCKPQINTEQRDSTIRFAIPQKNLCSCIQKIKNKHDGGADVAFSVSVCNTHSLVERLSALIVLLGNKDKDGITVKIYKRRLQQPHSQGNKYCKMKEEITSQKNYLKSRKKCDSEGQEIFAFILFY